MPAAVEPPPLVDLRLFAAAREAAGTAHAAFPAGTLEEVLDAACARFGAAFAEVLRGSRVWVNGDEPAGGAATPVRPGDEVAVLPPVSGGAGDAGDHGDRDC